MLDKIFAVILGIGSAGYIFGTSIMLLQEGKNQEPKTIKEIIIASIPMILFACNAGAAIFGIYFIWNYGIPFVE